MKAELRQELIKAMSRTYGSTENASKELSLHESNIIQQAKEELLDEIEKEELNEALNSQNLYKFKGKGNICPNCQKVGEFGSISRYTSMQKKEYYLCSRCNTISKVSL